MLSRPELISRFRPLQSHQLLSHLSPSSRDVVLLCFLNFGTDRLVQWQQAGWDQGSRTVGFAITWCLLRLAWTWLCNVCCFPPSEYMWPKLYFLIPFSPFSFPVIPKFVLCRLGGRGLLSTYLHKIWAALGRLGTLNGLIALSESTPTSFILLPLRSLRNRTAFFFFFFLFFNDCFHAWT